MAMFETVCVHTWIKWLISSWAGQVLQNPADPMKWFKCDEAENVEAAALEDQTFFSNKQKKKFPNIKTRKSENLKLKFIKKLNKPWARWWTKVFIMSHSKRFVKLQYVNFILFFFTYFLKPSPCYECGVKQICEKKKQKKHQETRNQSEPGGS